MENKIAELETRIELLEKLIQESVSSQQQMADLLKQLVNRTAENFSEINGILSEFDRKLSQMGLN